MDVIKHRLTNNTVKLSAYITTRSESMKSTLVAGRHVRLPPLPHYLPHSSDWSGEGGVGGGRREDV